MKMSGKMLTRKLGTICPIQRLQAGYKFKVLMRQMNVIKQIMSSLFYQSDGLYLIIDLTKYVQNLIKHGVNFSFFLSLIS